MIKRLPPLRHEELQWLNKPRAAQFTGLSTRTLDRLALGGDGPPRIRIGARWMYPRAALMDWMNGRNILTSETGRAK